MTARDTLAMLAQRAGYGLSALELIATAAVPGFLPGQRLDDGQIDQVIQAVIVLARFGPGADVYRLEFEDENVGGVGTVTANSGGGQSGGQSSGPRVASGRQQGLVRGRAREAGLDDMTLANIILQLAGSQPKQYGSVQEATAYLNQLLAAMPENYVDPLLQSIANYQQAAQAQAAQQAAAHAAAPASAETAIDGDVPSTLETVPVTAVAGVNGVAPVAA